MDFAVSTGTERNMCAFVCLVTSVSGKAQENFLPTVDNLLKKINIYNFYIYINSKTLNL